jgi:RNA polymerase sigma factor (sigma-70 family)
MVCDFCAAGCDPWATWRILCSMSLFLAIGLEPECLRRAGAGDPAAQREIYQRAAGPVFALVRRLVPGRAAAEDVFQDCMIRVLDRVGDFRGEAPFGAWVRQIAVRQCLMHLRSPWQRARRALRLDDGGDDPAPGAPDDARLDHASHELPLAELIDLERALARLPQVARSVVWLYDVEGLRHEEIAALFGRSVSFSKSQLARAHALLRAELGDAPPATTAPAAPLAAQVPLP